MYTGRGLYYQPSEYQQPSYQRGYQQLRTDQDHYRTQWRGNTRGRGNQRFNKYNKFNKQNNSFNKSYQTKQFKIEDKKEEIKKENINVEQQKQIIKDKKLKIDEILKEESIFSIKNQENQRTNFTNERIIATDNYSTLQLSLAAISEYKAMVDSVSSKERVFSEMWSCADHVYMRNQQLQMYLSTQEEIIGLINDEPSIFNIYQGEGFNQVEDVRYELEELKASKEFFKVFANYLPTKDRNNNTQIFLPYRYRHANGNIIGNQGNGLTYDITNNLGMVDATSYVKNAEAHNWQHFPLNANERTRRYDPLAVQQFMYQQTRANQQLQGGVPQPGNISFQQSNFDTEQFNDMFGCFVLNYSYNKQRTNNTQNRFAHQELHHGIFYYDQVIRFKQVLEAFPEINEKLFELSFNKHEIGIIRREPLKPVIWGLRQGGQEDGVFVIQGSSTLHVMSPFLFYNQLDAEAWGGFYLRVGQATQGFGDINLYVTERVGSIKYQIKTRTSFVTGLEKIFKKEKDEIFSSTLVAEM